MIHGAIIHPCRSPSMRWKGKCATYNLLNTMSDFTHIITCCQARFAYQGASPISICLNRCFFPLPTMSRLPDSPTLSKYFPVSSGFRYVSIQVHGWRRGCRLISLPKCRRLGTVALRLIPFYSARESEATAEICRFSCLPGAYGGIGIRIPHSPKEGTR